MEIKIIRDRHKGLITPDKLLNLVEKGHLPPSKAINYFNEKTGRNLRIMPKKNRYK